LPVTSRIFPSAPMIPSFMRLVRLLERESRVDQRLTEPFDSGQTFPRRADAIWLLCDCTRPQGRAGQGQARSMIGRKSKFSAIADCKSRSEQTASAAITDRSLADKSPTMSSTTSTPYLPAIFLTSSTKSWVCSQSRNLLQRLANAHFTLEPAVAMTRAPCCLASWIAVEPMPLDPPCTSKVSPVRACACKHIVETVK